MTKVGSGGCGGIGGDGGDALNFDVIFSDDARGQALRGESAGGAGGSFDIKEGNFGSVGRKSRIVDVAVETSQTHCRIAIQPLQIEVQLPVGIGAIGEEGEGGGIGRPGEIGFSAGLSGRSRGDTLALSEVVDGGNTDLAALEPGETLAVGRDGNLADGKTAVQVGEDLIELLSSRAGGRVSVLCADRQEVASAEKQRHDGTAKTARRERHRGDGSSKSASQAVIGGAEPRRMKDVV